jgi:hypothetical protein
MAKSIAKILAQNRATRVSCSSPVRNAMVLRIRILAHLPAAGPVTVECRLLRLRAAAPAGI